ncbi:MAG: polysaccharide deacetylase family protein [Porcipelethomonas sp.]
MYFSFKTGKLFKILLCDCIMIIFASVITLTGSDKWRALETECIPVPIIMYHSIHDSRQGDYVVSPETVENDLKYLKDNGYTAVFVEDIVSYVYGKSSLPEKPVVITADDGFYNNITYLLPLLEKYDMKATVSVVGYYSEVVAANDPHVPEYSYMTWDDIKEAIKSGRIEFGNHTYNMHSGSCRKGCSKLSYETDEEYAEIFTEDIGLMQSLMQINTGITPAVFTYPYGYISEESIPLLKKMGFTAALNCYEKPNYITHDESCLFTLNRYNRPAGISTEEFMKKALRT